MAKITGLPLAAPLAGDETLPLVQAGITRRLSLNGFVAAVVPFLQNWYKGDKGDPGGNAMAIGLFTAAAALAIPVGTDLVQTSGHTIRGVGSARYVYDPAVTASYVAARPRSAFRSTNGRGFRLAEQRLDVRHFGAIGGQADETAAVQAALDLVKDAPGQSLNFAGLTLAVDQLDYSYSYSATFMGAGATLVPLAGNRTAGRFSGDNWSDVAFVGFTFAQTARFNYLAAIEGQEGERVTVTDCIFQGCGGGWRFQAVQGGFIDRNIYREIGMMPRPSVPGVLDPSVAGFSQAFEIYGFGGRGVLCNDFHVGAGNDFRNSRPASGATSDVTGGAGGFSFYLGDRNIIEGRAINAPGQGAAHAGAWQGLDVVGQKLAGTFNPVGAGLYNLILNFYGEGCNQEAQTIFGCGWSHIVGARGRNNRAAVAELWDSWESTCDVLSAFEEVAAKHPIETGGYGAVAGRGAVHVINCWECDTWLRVDRARFCALSLAGSRGGKVAGRLAGFGAANAGTAQAAGIELGTGTYGRAAVDIEIDGCTFSAAPENASPTDIWSSVANKPVTLGEVRALGRAVALGGYTGNYRGNGRFLDGLGMAGEITRPVMRLAATPAPVNVNADAATPLLALGFVGSDSARLTVNGEDRGDGGRHFTDEVKVTSAGVRVLDSGDVAGAPAPRVYGFANGALTLRMTGADLSYSVRAAGSITLSGASYV